MITVEGDAFPARVGCSLYSSFTTATAAAAASTGTSTSVTNPNSTARSKSHSVAVALDADVLDHVLVSHSLKEVEDTTVRLTARHLQSASNLKPHSQSHHSSTTTATINSSASMSDILSMRLKRITTGTRGANSDTDTDTSNTSTSTSTRSVIDEDSGSNNSNNSDNNTPAGFMDSHHAVTKLFYSLEALYESEREEIISISRIENRTQDRSRTTSVNNRHFHVIHIHLDN